MPIPTRQGWKMNCRGVNLSVPIDQVPAGDYPYLNNVRVVQQGSIESRPGQAYVTNPSGNVHSIRRLNNLNPEGGADHQLFIGADNTLWASNVNNTVPTAIDSGYSGNPLSMVRFRPENSPEAWMYIADQNKMVKVNTELTVRNVGIAPPKDAPYAETYYTEAFAQQQIQIQDFFDTTGWTATGETGGLSVVQRLPIGVTAAYIIYDDIVGGNGFCCIAPSDGTTEWAQPGARITLDTGAQKETVPIQEVHPAIAATTIVAIHYDSGSTGPCSIVLGTAAQGLTRNSLLLFNEGECVRVLSSTVGPDGLYTIRASTLNTFGAGTVVRGLVSIRVSTAESFPLNGVPLSATAFQFNLTPAGDDNSGSIQVFQPIDCSVLNDRPIQPDDYMHISIKLDNPQNLLFGRVVMDVDSTENNFTRNYYQKEFRPSDFQGISAGQASVIATQTAIQNAYVEESGIPYVAGDVYTAPNLTSGTNLTETQTPQSAQIGTGSSVWTELTFRIADLQRVGSDLTRNLRDVRSLSIELTGVDNITCQVSAWWIGGTYGADVPMGSPVGIKYRYRYRDSRTGAKSIPGPGIRYDLFPLRQAVVLLASGSTDPQVDSIDFERLDPNLQTADGPPIWKYIGTQPNSQAGQKWFDEVTVAYLGGQESLDVTAIQPFPVLGLPLSGTVTTVGTRVLWAGGDKFPVRLLQNTVIRINGTAYETYATPISDTELELVGSAGSQTGVQFQVDSPIIFGTPLPFVFGPLEGPTASFMFGLGNTNNPGTLYWTNGNDFDGASDANYIEVTTPSEPLVSGVVWGTTIIVGSRDRLFMGQPTFGQANPFTFTEIPAGSGIWARWAISAGLDGVYYLGRDGVYRATPYYGGQMVSKDLWPLFPHEGIPGVTTNGYFPPNMALDSKLRISVADSDIYFDYVDSTGMSRTMRSAPTTSGGQYTPAQVTGWFPYSYGNPVNVHYWEEVPLGVTPRLLQCTTNGLVAAASGKLDINIPIVCEAQTPCINSEDSREQKLYVDCITDMVGSAQILILFNYAETQQAPVTITGTSRSQQRTTIDISSNLSLWLNISAKYTFAPDTVLYEFQPSFYPQPYLAVNLVTQFTNHGMSGWKQQRFARMCIIAASPVTFTIRDDIGRSFAYTIPAGINPINLYQNDFNLNYQQKARLFEYSLTAEQPFAFFHNESIIRMKKWGGKEFVDVQPFLV